MTLRGLRFIAFVILCLAASSCAGTSTDSQPRATPTPATDPVSVTALEATRDAVNADPVNFGGAYFDVSGTTLVVLVADADEEDVAMIKELIPAGANVAWVAVQFSMSELQHVSDEIVETWRGLEIGQINSVSVDMPANRVLVSFPAGNPELESQFRARFSDAVTFTIEPPSNPL